MTRDINLLLAMLCLLIQLLIHTVLVAINRDLSLADDNELPTNAAELNKFHEFSQEDVGICLLKVFKAWVKGVF